MKKKIKKNVSKKIKNDNTNKKMLMMVGVIILAVVIIAGATFAYWSWETTENQKTNIIFTAEKDFSCAADGGGDITSSSLEDDNITIVPSACTNSSHVIKREIKLTTTVDNKTIYTNMWLNVNSIGSYLSGNSNFKYTLTSSDSCDTDIVTSGNFGDVSEGDTIPLVEQAEYSVTTTEVYYLWIWLDKTEVEISTSDEASRSFDLSLGGSCADSNITE